MTKQQLEKKLNLLLISLRADMVTKMEKIIQSGCTNIEAAEDDYSLPKQILCAVLKDEVESYMPNDKSGRAEVNNFRKFI